MPENYRQGLTIEEKVQKLQKTYEQIQEIKFEIEEIQNSFNLLPLISKEPLRKQMTLTLQESQELQDITEVDVYETYKLALQRDLTYDEQLLPESNYRILIKMKFKALYLFLENQGK